MKILAADTEEAKKLIAKTNEGHAKSVSTNQVKEKSKGYNQSCLDASMITFDRDERSYEVDDSILGERIDQEKERGQEISEAVS